MKNDNIALPELLAPAGSAESFSAAIAAGADAVYFGAERFSARARAKNLSLSEMETALRDCRARGVKAYGAINTRLRDGELSDAVECAWEMLSMGTDALIVADLGLAHLLRQTFPEAELHASTQVTGTSAADAAVLKELGFSRMVCPRELSISEIGELVKKSPIDIEMFIHGAHCVSVSGQCSMSYVMGGRSGNRGDCAGPCRLPFDAGLGRGNAHLPKSAALSLKDMCLAGHVREILNSGVSSLKIEGRMKGPEYTYGVVKIYRALLDARRDATPDEMAMLGEYFSRDGFSDGYFMNRYARMLGTRKDSEIRQDSERFPAAPMEKVPAQAKLRLHCGESATLTLTTARGTATVTGDVLAPATGNPPPMESLVKSIGKLGQTPFVLEGADIDTDGVCGISASALNALRRSAVDVLLAPRPVVRADFSADPIPGAKSNVSKASRTAILSSADQYTDAVAKYFDHIFIPYEEGLPRKAGVSLPEVMYPFAEEKTAAIVSEAVAEERSVLVHTLGELKMAVGAGARAVCSHRFVVYNSVSAATLRRLGADVVTMSPEVPLAAATEVSKSAAVAALTGGRMPLMLCRRCPMSDGGRLCKMSRSGGFDGKEKPHVCRGYLTDRTGAVLPAVGGRDCITVIYNSVPTWTDMTHDDAARLGISDMVHMFAAEDADECDAVVAMLRRGAKPDKFRRP